MFPPHCLSKLEKGTSRGRIKKELCRKVQNNFLLQFSFSSCIILIVTAFFSQFKQSLDSWSFHAWFLYIWLIFGFMVLSCTVSLYLAKCLFRDYYMIQIFVHTSMTENSSVMLVVLEHETY